MVGAYISRVIEVVERVCKANIIPEGLFWDWLGNKKFKQDNGNLTPERAEEIRRNIMALIDEYKGEENVNLARYSTE